MGEVGSPLEIERRILLQELRDAPVHHPPPRGRNLGIDAANDEIVREAKAAVGRQQHRQPLRAFEREADAASV
jgi:hypothetical protein